MPMIGDRDADANEEQFVIMGNDLAEHLFTTQMMGIPPAEVWVTMHLPC